MTLAGRAGRDEAPGGAPLHVDRPDCRLALGVAAGDFTCRGEDLRWPTLTVGRQGISSIALFPDHLQQGRPVSSRAHRLDRFLCCGAIAGSGRGDLPFRPNEHRRQSDSTISSAL